MAYDSSYKPTPPEKYDQPQCIVDSGRLLFNAKEDSILMFSSKAIGLSSNSSVNIDTGKFIVNADRIDLGLNAGEPLVRGQKLSDLLLLMIDALENLSLQLEQVVSTPPGTPIPQITIAAQLLKVRVKSLYQNLPEIRSKQNFTL